MKIGLIDVDGHRYPNLALSRCGYNALEANNYTFCPKCGSPFTDEAVEMVMERLNKLEETKK